MTTKTWLTMMILLVVACGGGTDADTSVTSEGISNAAPETTIASTALAPTAATTTTAVRGDPVDFGPPAGATLGVVGVVHNDVLNLRDNPGTDRPIVAEIPPTSIQLEAQGHTRSLPAFWTEVSYKNTNGWVNLSFLAYLGATDDITTQVISTMGGRPDAPTMTELGRMVAEAMASDDPPSQIVNVVEESVGDLGEVTYDVIGLGDDSVRGVRLHIFGAAHDDGFALRSVENTVLCDPTRGVDNEGSCA